MPIVLDTDILSILNSHSEPAYSRLRVRLRQQSEPTQTTTVNFQERVQGWMGVLHQARSDGKVLRAYQDLLTTLEEFRETLVLPFNEAALAVFNDLRRQKIRVGTLDLRIASIALTTGSTLISRNLRDFRRVPGLVVEDWTL